MSKAYIRFWGVRGSYAAPFSTHLDIGGNTSCVEIRVDDHLLVCDAGTGVIPLGEQLMKEGRLQRMLLILTHYHWDHICGLPFFVPAFSPDWNITFFGPGENARIIEQRLSNQMRAPYFPVETETWMANIDYLEPSGSSFDYGPMSIAFHNVHHPGVTYGYRINVNGKSVVYISDNECLFLEKSLQQRIDEFSAQERELMERMKNEERVTELSLIKDADILIHDAQYTPEDYEHKRGWGHSCYIDTVNTAIDANVKELYLYHHDPNYDDGVVHEIHRKALEIVRKRGSSLQCHIAREGMIIDLS